MQTTKRIIHGFVLPVALALLTGAAVAQSTPAAKSQPSPAPKAQAAPAAKVPDAPAPKAQPAQAENPAFKNENEKSSYAVGMNIGENLKRNSIDVDPDALMKGIKDALAGKTLLTDEEARDTLRKLQAELQAKQAAKMQAAAEANKKEGEAFLAANKTKEGVVTLPSGLQYKILTEGKGPKPTAADKVVCNYRGTLVNGSEFDSSYKRNEPATFPVTGVIKGWTEALQLMPVGSKWQLFIPSDLAYGPPGRGPVIGPNATLIFEVELLSIEPKTQDKK